MEKMIEGRLYSTDKDELQYRDGADALYRVCGSPDEYYISNRFSPDVIRPMTKTEAMEWINAR